MARTVLVDGDIIAYRAGFACEHKQYYATIDGEDLLFESKTELNKYIKDHESVEIEWESKLTVEPLQYALSTVKHMLNGMKAATKSDTMEVYLSGPTNFRDQIATIAKYKGNRDQQRRPLHHEQIIRYMLETHDAIRIDGVEADDMLATRQIDSAARGEDTVIASIDKDLLQIPGKHFNFVTGEKINVTPATALKNKYIQMLTGDGTDNIPGIRGVGPAKAEKILAECKDEASMKEAVYAAWAAYFSGDSKPQWLVSFNQETGDVTYTDKIGYIRTPKLDDLLHEIEKLITVGVPDGRIQ